MKYTELIESCKKAIEKGYCGGCQGIEQEEYRGDPNCPYKIPSAQESIKSIYKNLGVDKNGKRQINSRNDR